MYVSASHLVDAAERLAQTHRCEVVAG